MALSFLAVPALILLLLTSMVILLNLDWEVNLLALAVQYLGVFYFTAQSWPFGMAAVKLLVGWMAAAALAMTMIGQQKTENESLSFVGRLFPFLAGCLAIILVFSFAPQAVQWFPANTSLFMVESGLILMMMGLLQLGITGQPLRVILGLLTMIAGFEILYASVEVSILVTGLLAAVNLGLALVGAYLITSSTTESGQ